MEHTWPEPDKPVPRDPGVVRKRGEGCVQKISTETGLLPYVTRGGVFYLQTWNSFMVFG